MEADTCNKTSTMVTFIKRWDGNVFLYGAPLPSMVFHWFCYNRTITIECFFARLTIDIDGLSMVLVEVNGSSQKRPKRKKNMIC